MALQEFWNNVRIGARLIAPQVVADAPGWTRHPSKVPSCGRHSGSPPAPSRDSTRRISRSSPRKSESVWRNSSTNSARWPRK